MIEPWQYLLVSLNSLTTSFNELGTLISGALISVRGFNACSNCSFVLQIEHRTVFE